jgi:hypothetical protein
VREQVGYPHGVVHIGLASGNVANMRRIGKHQLKPIFYSLFLKHFLFQEVTRI